MTKISTLTLGLLLGALTMATLPGKAQGNNQEQNSGGYRTSPSIQKPKSDKVITIKLEWIEAYNSQRTTRSVMMRTMDGVLVKSLDMAMIPQTVTNGDGQVYQTNTPIPRRSLSVTPEIGQDGKVLLDISATWPTYAVNGSASSYADREFSTIRKVSVGDTVILRAVDGKVDNGSGTVISTSEILSVTVTVE